MIQDIMDVNYSKLLCIPIEVKFSIPSCASLLDRDRSLLGRRRPDRREAEGRDGVLGRLYRHRKPGAEKDIHL